MSSIVFTTTSATSPETLTLLQALLSTGAISTTTTPTATTPGQPSPDMQAFLAAIPTAREGDVITPEFHNSMVSAIRQLSLLLGEPAFARLVSVSTTPSFQPEGALPPWRYAIGVAVAPPPPTGATTSSARGWMPLNLPHGTHIEKFEVTGVRSGPVASCRVQLQRIPVADPSQTTTVLVDISLTTPPQGGGPFDIDGPVSVPNATPAQLEEYSRVDTDNYKYVAYARLTDADPTADVRIASIQVQCSRR